MKIISLKSRSGAPLNVARPVPADSVRERLEEQISRLQQRQMDMVRETADELETLRQDLASTQEISSQTLLAEIEELREQIACKDCTLQALEAAHFQERERMQKVLDTLKGAVDGQLRTLHQQLRTLSLDALKGIESMLDAIEEVSLPTADRPSQASVLPAISRPAAKPAVKKPAPALPQTVKETPRTVNKKAEESPLPVAAPRKGRKLRRLIRRTLSLAMFAGLAFGGWHWYVQNSLPELGTVAGVSTDNSITSPTPAANAVSTPAPDEHKESTAVVSYADTQWDKLNDIDYGISMDYPKNATNVVHAVGGENFFFLRDGGYILKISKNELSAGQNFDQYMVTARQDYGVDYIFKQGNLNNRPVWIAASKDHTAYTGTQYFVSRPGKNGKPDVVYQVWAKDEAPESDDGKRLDRMLNSLQFSS